MAREVSLGVGAIDVSSVIPCIEVKEMEEYRQIIEWLLQDSDPSLTYQVNRDLLKRPEKEIQEYQMQIARKGWGKELLDKRRDNGQWGNGVYNPKWTCTHYVLYELVQLEMEKSNDSCRQSAELLLTYPVGRDGGINYARTVEYSDVCINGMILTITSYFNIQNPRIIEIVDYLLKVQMKDGGWNCEYFHGARHSSLHTTISVIEGLKTYLGNSNIYQSKAIEEALKGSIEFILKHRLFRSETTGEVIKDEFFKFYFPIRWKYDILRCLDLFRKYDVQYDRRMDEALEKLAKSCNGNGRWKAYSQPGKTYFIMEKQGVESKWNTLRALRVLMHYNAYYHSKARVRECGFRIAVRQQRIF
ncbi:MAG: hypothetical protein APF77_22090 [Clostridia bacterium BRH_c25]|nr:MAG: hypothetical protein APF77_22090 [Clostridia bacterium BRH_c25]